MPRVLLISPHFPPDSSAGTHRVRLLAPHLPAYGWEPTVLTVDPRDCEGPLDARLAGLVPPDLRVIRSRAWSARLTRPIGIGDLGVRALAGLRSRAISLFARERFDALFITIYPTYPAVLGPMLKRRFGVPFVLDYQDPWVGAWGRTVGGGPGGAVDMKSRLTRAVAAWLEPRVVRAADALVGVSRRICDDVLERVRPVPPPPCVEIPIGVEPADFDRLREQPIDNPYFDAKDGCLHLSYVGALLPEGRETLHALLEAVALLRDRRPALYERVRLHFVGTSNRREGSAAPVVLPVAQELGVAARVTEAPLRADYLTALGVQVQSTAVLLLGSSEPHYTPSKLYGALLAHRPLLALYHEASTAVGVIERVTRPPTVRLVTYGDRTRARACVETIFGALADLCAAPQVPRRRRPHGGAAPVLRRDAGRAPWPASSTGSPAARVPAGTVQPVHAAGSARS